MKKIKSVNFNGDNLTHNRFTNQWYALDKYSFNEDYIIKNSELFTIKYEDSVSVWDKFTTKELQDLILRLDNIKEIFKAIVKGNPTKLVDIGICRLEHINIESKENYLKIRDVLFEIYKIYCFKINFIGFNKDDLWFNTDINGHNQRIKFLEYVQNNIKKYLLETRGYLEIFLNKLY